MATKDGRAQIWYANGNGIVEGNTESVGDIAGTIIDVYNEHFGTDIQIWTPETIELQVSDSVPNWNAYEKILIQLTDGFYKYDLTGGNLRVFVCMQVQNGVVSVYTPSLEEGSDLYSYNSNGGFNGANVTAGILSNISQICSNYPNFVSVSRIVKDNSDLENWDEYTLLQ